ncbi:hypothetical protein Taro_015983 [Colocasia esculenta]|uniref:Uncharacterized protein n=1 Tax=Colocasia esculenta TaxID=4460 RepID=A0A843UJ37_COLES|nr:hypothetical protein [Colocasia esculenta]
MFGPTLVVGHGISLFHCFVALYSSLLPLLLEFLLLWLGLAVARVRCRTIMVAACLPCVASSVSCERERLYCELRVAFLQVLEDLSVSCGRVLLLLLGARAASVVSVSLVLRLGSSSALRPCGCVAKAERAYMWCGLHRGRVVACGSSRRVPLPLGLLLCSLKSSAVLPPWFEVSVVWLVAVALPSRLRCIAWLPCVLVWFPRTVGCCSGESSLLPLLLGFLLLWPVRDWLSLLSLVRKAHPPTLFR